VRQGVLDFAARTLADVTAHVDDVDFIGHVDLALVHVIEHFLGALGPDFIVPAMAEQTDADDDVSREGQPLLRFHELLLEARAAAEGDDGVLGGHGLESGDNTSFVLDRFKEIGLGPNPDTLVAVHGLVNHGLLAGSLDGGERNQAINLPIAEMTIILAHAVIFQLQI